MVVKWQEVNWYEHLQSHGVLEQPKKLQGKPDKHGHIRRDVLNIYTAFDIETSTVWLDDDHSKYNVHSFMYIWQFQLDEYTVIGRTWDDFTEFQMELLKVISRLQEYWNLPVLPKMIIWVHNLSFEFSFLSGIYPFQNDECFFRDFRKPIYCQMFECFEFRCSYIQTNMSLAELCKQMQVPQKLSGQQFDYSKIRYPWTELTEYEMEYVITDVSSLVKAMQKRIEKNGDNLLTVPLTSTGYVRRDCREALKKRYGQLKKMMPGLQQYKLLRAAFRGGNTHANRQLVGQIIDDVYSYDIASSYPTQQLTRPFPMEKFTWFDFSTDRYKEQGAKLAKVLQFISFGYAVVGKFAFKHIRLKDAKEPIPYIARGRCDAKLMVENINGQEKMFPLILDNGRVLEAGYLEISLTEIDLQIILDQYDFDEIDVQSAMYAKKNYLPEEYRKVIMQYYEKKTALKGFDADNEEEAYIYQKSKNLLNAVYGMSATDPIHQEILYNGGDYTRSNYETWPADKIDEVLREAPFPYQWGVYTTAYARLQLEQAIQFCKKETMQPDGNCKLLYCDTDSIKVAGNIPIEKLNGPYLKNAKTMKAFADDRKHKRHYIGLFEPDAHYQRFITQGAKRYAYEKDGGKMGITVAGVSKNINEKTGIPFAVEELGRLEKFVPGMVWKNAGGTIAVYNDEDDFELVDDETGRSIHIGKNVSIVESTYTMMLGRDYGELLENIKLYGQYKKEHE